MNNFYSNNIFLYNIDNNNKKNIKKNNFYTYNELSISKLLKK